jgi:hypothetical protein
MRLPLPVSSGLVTPVHPWLTDQALALDIAPARVARADDVSRSQSRWSS